MTLLDDLISLFYPWLCAGCSTPLLRGEEVLCLSCIADLPRTNYHLNQDNPVFQIFIGRVNVTLATSYCRFDKGGRLQHILHQLKYNGNCEIGHKIGNLFGYDLIQSPLYQDISAIIPVPLHPKKRETKRL